MVGIRMGDDLQSAIRRWASTQPDKPKLAEAIRRLVEIGLATASKPRPAGTHRGAAKASELAGTQIDRLAGASATDEHWQKRKHRILKEPTEFREMRKDQSKRKDR